MGTVVASANRLGTLATVVPRARQEMHTAQPASSPTPLRVDKITAMLLRRLARLPFRIYRCRAAKRQSLGSPLPILEPHEMSGHVSSLSNPSRYRACVSLAHMTTWRFWLCYTFSRTVTCVRNTENGATMYLAH